MAITNQLLASCFCLLLALFLALSGDACPLDRKKRWAFTSRIIPLTCTILWKRRNSESCDSPSRIKTCDDITYQHILGTYTGQLSSAHVCPRSQTSLSGRSVFSVAITTVNRLITAWFKRYFGIFATIGTCHRKHLASGPVAAGTAVIAATAPLRLPCLAARGTAFWLINIAFGLEKLLFLSAESEGSPTIGTLERLVLKTHWITSSLLIVGQSLGHPILKFTLK